MNEVPEKKVEKRDGRLTVFDTSKITKAMMDAFASTCKQFPDLYSEEDAKDFATFATDTANSIANKVLKETKQYTVEEISDIVEKRLMPSKYKEVAKEYITYREQRSLARSSKSKLTKVIMSKLKASDVQNQNANVDEHSFGGRIGEASDAMLKEIALNYCVSKKSKYNHVNNLIYIHDLASYPVGNHNCLTLPLDDLLKNGFNTRQTDVRPARSVSTALQLLAVTMQLQSLQQFGGVSASHVDWSLVPYVRMSFTKHFKDGLRYIEKLSFHQIERFEKYLKYDLNSDNLVHFDNLEVKEKYPSAWEYAMDKTEQEVEQAIEGMYHNLNTLQSRSGNQLPFSSINYGTCTLEEGRLVTRCLLEVSIEGIGKLHKTSIFPCGIFQSMKGVNQKEGDPNYDLFQLALKSTAKRLYPNYANVDWSGNAGYDRKDPRTFFSTMGCRTANGWDINGLGQLKDGRGNICPVTIIMPTVAMETKERVDKKVANSKKEFSKEEIQKMYVDEFLKALDAKIADAKDMLLERFDWICSQSPESAKFMYENNVMAGYKPEEGIRSALKHGTLAIGNLGLAETLQILVGCDHTEDKGMEVAKEIYALFAERCKEFKEKEHLNFGVYNTPRDSWVA